MDAETRHLITSSTLAILKALAILVERHVNGVDHEGGQMVREIADRYERAADHE